MFCCLVLYALFFNANQGNLKLCMSIFYLQVSTNLFACGNLSSM